MKQIRLRSDDAIKKLAFSVVLELSSLSYFYDETIKSCIEAICYKNDLQLSELEKQSLYTEVVATLRNIAALRCMSDNFSIGHAVTYGYIGEVVKSTGLNN